MKKSDLVLFEQIQHAFVVLLDHRVFATNHLGHVQAQALDLNAVVSKMMTRLLVVLRRLQ